MRAIKKTEHSEQVALFDWKGKSAVIRGLRMVNEGLKKGVPDIFLGVPRKGKHGLFIELKVGKNKPSKNQLWWIHSLRAEGYAVEVCYGFLEAQTAIIDFLGIEVQ